MRATGAFAVLSVSQLPIMRFQLVQSFTNTRRQAQPRTAETVRTVAGTVAGLGTALVLVGCAALPPSAGQPGQTSAGRPAEQSAAARDDLPSIIAEQGAICPQVRLAPQARRWIAGPQDEDRAAVAVLTNLTGSCRPSPDGEGVEITLDVTLLAERGFSGPLRQRRPYQVRILRQGRPQPLAQRQFEAHLRYEPGQNRAGTVESLSQVLPLGHPREAASYVIEVALSATPGATLSP